MIDPIVAKIKKVRTDLSDWAWHFVNRGERALDDFESILDSQKVKGSYNYACQATVICFTEAPAYQFAQQSKLLVQHAYSRLDDYGVGFRKQWLFERGGLPVIYQPQQLLDKYGDLPSEYRFRHVPYDPVKGPDYTWQREWRVSAAELNFTKADVVIVVPTLGAAQRFLFDAEEDGDYIDGEPVTFASFVPQWSFIAHDQFENIIHLDDNAIELSVRDDLILPTHRNDNTKNAPF